MAKAMKKSGSSSKSMVKAPKKAQIGRAIKKLCRPGEDGCPQTRGMSGYGRGGGYNKRNFKSMFSRNK